MKILTLTYYVKIIFIRPAHFNNHNFDILFKKPIILFFLEKAYIHNPIK